MRIIDFRFIAIKLTACGGDSCGTAAYENLNNKPTQIGVIRSGIECEIGVPAIKRQHRQHFQCNPTNKFGFLLLFSFNSQSTA